MVRQCVTVPGLQRRDLWGCNPYNLLTIAFKSEFGENTSIDQLYFDLFVLREIKLFTHFINLCPVIVLMYLLILQPLINHFFIFIICRQKMYAVRSCLLGHWSCDLLKNLQKVAKKFKRGSRAGAHGVTPCYSLSLNNKTKKQFIIKILIEESVIGLACAVRSASRLVLCCERPLTGPILSLILFEMLLWREWKVSKCTCTRGICGRSSTRWGRRWS